MPEIKISVGGRSYSVACQAGEETQLQTAADLLDTQAQSMLKAAPSLPEGQLLLMAGLMLADQSTAEGDRERYADTQIEELRDKLRKAEERAGQLSRELEMKAAPVADTGGAEHALLEKMAVELERLADEMEAASA